MLRTAGIVGSNQWFNSVDHNFEHAQQGQACMHKQRGWPWGETAAMQTLPCLLLCTVHQVAKAMSDYLGPEASVKVRRTSISSTAGVAQS